MNEWIKAVFSAANVLKDRDKIKTLIADISHQTKTPIANLLLHSELLRETDLDADQKESLDAIENEAEKLRFLVDALVKLSRLENGILVLTPQEWSIGKLIKETESAVRKKAEGKGLSFSVTDDDETAVFDYKWTLEALCNIAENAVKYTDKGGIHISIKSTEMFSCISVKDTGIGIAEEDIPKIFARFGRLSSSRDKEGVGIGLYLAREIITKEGGYIKTEYEYTVCAYVEVPIDISERRSSGMYDVIVGADVLKSDFGESVVPLFYAFDTASVEDEEKAENYMHDYCEENTGITYESKAVRRADFEGFKNMFVLVGGLLSLIIGFVGILNFLNTIMAGIITRKNEIAVLQAIGMTGKQVKEMLITEGMIYTAGSGAYT